jgi:hypothetical protein
MGLKDLYARLMKGADRQKLERAAQESQMAPREREIDQEDYEGRKDDTYVLGETYPGAETGSIVSDELEP